MECISADTIEEILERLPVKTLLRFKCVCRRWRALIQSRSFIRRHYHQDSNQEHLLLQWGEYVEGRLEENDCNPLWLDYCDKHRCHRIGPSFGLMLEVWFSGDIVLLNPATHKAKLVPPPPLIPDLSVSLLRFGLGVEIESSSGDYKIVAYDSEAAAAFAWVYNSTSDCWKRIEGVFSWEIEAWGWQLDARFLNGVYYWVLGDDGELGWKLLAFDMMTEKFRVFEAPRGVRAFAAYGESKSIAVMSQQGGDTVVWVMGEQGIWSECWRYRDSSVGLFELCVWKGEVFFWDLGDDNVVVVDVTTQNVRIHQTGCPGQYPTYRRPLCCYKESLLSIKGEQDLSSLGDDLTVHGVTFLEVLLGVSLLYGFYAG